jgi:hypothetical protein
MPTADEVTSLSPSYFLKRIVRLSIDNNNKRRPIEVEKEEEKKRTNLFYPTNLTKV